LAGLTILKLGGSAVTKKEKPFTPNVNAINRLAGEIKKAKVKPLLIIHGGGSFGHPLANKYKIKEGYRTPAQVLGFSKTHYAMVKLNKLILDSLIRQGIPAVSIQPSACIVTKNGRIKYMETKPLLNLLEIGFTPILYGDAVIDLAKGFTILSGDQLASSLAVNLNARRIIFGVDVDGLFTANPKLDPTAKLFKELSIIKLRKLKRSFAKAKVTDVTGGMLGKILELTPAIEKGVPAIIVNAAKPSRVYKALRDKKVIGTIIKAR
jgi:isopentenyl phosphate kinase